MPQGIDNLLVAGRCHSATSEALASSRVTATAMGMGQAAGTAAALACGSDKDTRKIDMDLLRQRLLQTGAILQAPPAEQVKVGDPNWK